MYKCTQSYLLMLCFLGILFLPAGAQPTTTRELYVKPTEDTSCPVPCHTLDEYVQNATQYFVSNTTFNFIPGSHYLSQSLHVRGVTNLALVTINVDSTVNITGRSKSSLSFAEIANLTLENLIIDLCSALVLTDLLHLNLLGVGIKSSYYSPSLHATNMLGTSTIAGLQFMAPIYTEPYNMFSFHIYYTDHYTWPLPIDNQLTVKDIVWRNPQVNLKVIHLKFELNQSTYGVGVLLDNLTVTFYTINIHMRINEGSPNNITLINLYLVAPGADYFGDTFLIHFVDSPISNTSMTIRNCVWSSLTMIFELKSTEVTIEDTTLEYPFGGHFALRDHRRRPFVMSNVRVTNCKRSDVFYLQDAVVHLYESSNVNFTNCEFSNNTVTPLAAFESTFVLSGSNIFSNNTASQGGAMAFYEQSHVILANGSDTLFLNNTAKTVGGAVYIDYGLPYCFFVLNSEHRCSLFHASTDEPVPNVTLWFDGNVAVNGGNTIYGASLDTCQIGNYSCQGWNYVDSLLHINQRNGSLLSAITSEPLRACLCDEDGKPSCTTFVNDRTVFPGEPFHVSAVVVGDRFGTVDGSVYAQLLPLNGPYVAELVNLERSQRVTHSKCANLSYTILSNSSGGVSLVLTASSAPVQKYPDNNIIYFKVPRLVGEYKSRGCVDPLLRSFPVFINIVLHPCPLGFILSASEPYQCVCDLKLQHNHIPCNLTTQTIQRSGTEWVNASFHNHKSNGAIVNKYCPNNYCKQEIVNISLEHPDAQCAFNHSGILCGECQSGLSLALGSVQCLQCSNAHLTLLIPFALAGFALVFFIKLLDLTVAKGTLNGLIFYANIVRANQVAWIPGHDTNILTVFIAWINLDLGIETCFFDGLDAYWKVWLNICFVLYLWAILILISVLCHYYTIVTKIFGRNLIQVLATVFLLLYLKLLRIVIPILQYSTLIYPDGTSATVWSYDGNIPYLGPLHAPLFAVALAIILFLWLPYTGILCFAQCLQRIPGQKVTSIHVKLKPFLDAYLGSFKDNHQYWVGLLLLVRSALFVIVAEHYTLHSEAIYLAMLATVLSLVVYLGLFSQVYKNKYLSLLENSFLLNVGILAGGTLYLRASSGSQTALAYTSVGVAFVEFVAIVAFHTATALQRFKARLGNRNHQVTAPNEQQVADMAIIDNSNNYSAANVINRGAGHELAISYGDYREPILKYVDPQN